MTTLSVALAARWPEPARALLVEADPSGGDIATRFGLESAPGLVSLTVAGRRSADPALAWQHTQSLPGGLLVVSAPPDADRARAALLALTSDRPAHAGGLRLAADQPGAAVIVDCGRVDAGSSAMPFVRAADVMVLLARSRADDLAHLARRLPEVGRWARRSVLLLVGDGYSTTEVARELGVSPWGRVPEDVYGAAVLCGRPCGFRWRRVGPSHSPLGRFAHTVARTLAASAESAQVPQQVVPVLQPPVLRAVPGVPDNLVAVHGLRPPPAPRPAQPGFDDQAPRGGAAS
ncbi:chromosome partitioning protein [Amycolatopsis sp. NPDC059657]|uniref:chromosome partitioning protein n=1 Tax=Amycolatopsis sp. NPDC059657 TaxID=3346899 RepID=UPI00367277DE